MCRLEGHVLHACRFECYTNEGVYDLEYVKDFNINGFLQSTTATRAMATCFVITIVVIVIIDAVYSYKR